MKTLSLKQEHLLKKLLDNHFLEEKELARMITSGSKSKIREMVRRVARRGWNIVQIKREDLTFYFLDRKYPIISYPENSLKSM
jgi:hypothetical protein